MGQVILFEKSPCVLERGGWGQPVSRELLDYSKSNSLLFSLPINVPL